MLVKEITQTMVTKKPDKVLELVSNGFTLKVLRRGKILYEITPPKIQKSNIKRVVDAMYLLDEYLIPLTPEELQNDRINQSIPEQYHQVPAIKLGFNLTYGQNQSTES